MPAAVGVVLDAGNDASLDGVLVDVTVDLEAFPQFYPEEIRTGRYSDSHDEDDGYVITLIRDIMKGQTEDNNDESLHISISSIVDSKNKDFGTMYEKALEESARCFNRELDV